ncbi:MAG: endonuclease III, partial [Burkholderiales bacterium]
MAKLSPSEKANLIFARLSAENPAPETELIYTNPYTLLVAVVLSAQATDISVNKATSALFTIADTPEKMLQLGEEKLKSFIRTIGLFNAKAQNIIQLSKILIQQYQSQVPCSLEALQALPGVGRKTANVMLNCAFSQPTIAVDTHVYRVSRRLGLSHASTPLGVEKDLDNIVKEPWKMHAHHWLILH